MKLESKVALITGGTSGIGRATAILFSQEGAKIVVIGRRQEEGEKTVDLVRDKGGQAIYIKADVSQPRDVKEMVRRAIKAYQRIDILFNNAGVHPESARRPVAECSVEDWDKVMDINVKGIFLVSKAVIPGMIKQGGGVIINTSSVLGGYVSAKNRAIYAASKGAVGALSRSMALDYASFNIRVNCILPGLVETEMGEKLIRSAQQAPGHWEHLMSQYPIGRVGRAKDIAHAVLFLASDESNWMTGTLVTLDGGYTAQ